MEILTSKRIRGRKKKILTPRGQRILNKLILENRHPTDIQPTSNRHPITQILTTRIIWNQDRSELFTVVFTILDIIHEDIKVQN